MKKILIASVVAPMVFAAMPLLASAHFWNFNSGTSIVVSNSNSGSVVNNVNTSSNTGSNNANGGNGKNGGDGGAIFTGDALSVADVETSLNSNKTSIDLCGCVGKIKSVTVGNSNSASVTNNVNTSASTGGNNANGGNGSSWSWFSYHSGSAGDGGFIKSGDAGSQSTVVTVANSNVTKLN